AGGAKGGANSARRDKGTFFAKASRADFASPYLMTGFLRCTCGGALGGVAALHGTGPSATRKRVTKYGCSYNRNRGAVACANDFALRCEAIDEAVLMALRRIVAPDMGAEAGGRGRAVERALAVLVETKDEYAERRAALEAQVAEAEARCSRLVKALGAGGELESLVAGLKTAQEEKDEAKAALAAMPPVPEQIDTEAI